MAEAVEVAPGVLRLTCANPGPMTATGTQSYLVGRREVAVIDPGPADVGHLEALRGAIAARPVVAILVTHSHRDHSGGAPALAAATGAPVLAFGPHGAGMSATMRALAQAGDLGGGEGADAAFHPDRRLEDGALVTVDGRQIRALHTPGHLSNHLSFALEAEGLLFTGDTVMGWSTTLVSPPEGDMAAFMATLARLSARRGLDRRYLPGHGAPVDNPADLLARQTAHREARARSVLAALAAGPASAAELTPRVYVDTPAHLHAAARRNLLATLLWRLEAGEIKALGPIGPDTRFALA